MEPAGVSRDRRQPTAGPAPIDMTGQTIGHWTVLRQTWSRRDRAQWLCQCTCSAEAVIAGTRLRAMGRRGMDPCRACGTGQAAAPADAAR